MILLTPGSQAHQILELLLLVGELPYNCLSMLGNERTWRNTIQRMNKPGQVFSADRMTDYTGCLIHVSGKGNLRTIRLAAASFGFLGAVFPDGLRYYLCHYEGHHFRGNAGNISRNHRLAELVIQFRKAGIECHPEHLPPLSKCCKQRRQISAPGFYPSRYLKGLECGEMNKTKFTRMAGALMLPDECCVVYNCSDSAPKWSTSGEQKALADVRQIVLHNTTLPMVESAMLFGKDMESAMRVLRGMQEWGGACYDSNNDYSCKYYLPMDDFGAGMLQMMSIRNWKQRLLELMFLPESIQDRRSNLCFDAYENGEYILLFMDCDLQKLDCFYAQVSALRCRWSVLCFPQQVKLLRAYMGNTAILRHHGFEKVLAAMKEGSDAK